MNTGEPQSASGEAASAFDARAVTGAIRRGDEAAFELFYDRYCGRLFRLLLTWTRGDEATARDVLQTVMIKLARKMPVFATEGALGSWLTQVTRHALIDHWRRRRRMDNATPAEVAALLDLPAETAADGARLTWLEGAIADLDAADRWLVDQYYFKRRPQQDLAMNLGKTPKAVESKLARVRRELRAAWQRHVKNGR